MGLPETSPANSNSMQRVKVYRLNDDGKWDDQGTGHVTVDYLERSEELGLFVIDEEDNETLLIHRISSNDIYRKQEDTIISWRDPEYSTELALSFQETTGCSYIWDQICNVQRNLHFNTLNNETFHRVASELRELPSVELMTLPLILKTVVESGIADQTRLTELILNDQVFLGKLLELFHICEDLENIDGLHMIFKIVRGIINLNSPQIFEKIFGDDMIMDIIGSLENDPDFSHPQHHRNFLKEHVVFKEAIPIKNVLALSKIHQTYRVSYLKDVVLARVLDEASVANLNSIIHANNAIVVSLLKDDTTFLQELFARLRSPTICLESKKNLVYFLHEFCSLSKSLQMVQQLRLFRDLMNEGIFEIITDVLQSEDKRLVLTGTDVLIFFLNQDPSLLRSYVIRQEGTSLFGLLVKGMITDFEDNMHCQFLEILRNLLDSYSIAGAQRDTIIEIFYEQHFSHLIDIMTESCSSGCLSQSTNKVGSFGANLGNKNAMKPEILSNICELLCFCVLHHPYKIKYCFLLNKVVDKVLLLTRRREKYLVVAAVRFVRTILSRHDEHLINHFVKNDLLKPIIEAFVVNGNRYNLLNSAVLDLLEYIRKENLKPLVIYIVDSFWNELVQFEYLASIQSLRVKYEQCQETCEARESANIMDTKNRIEERVLEKGEEDYFNGESDEEDTASPSVSHKQKVQSQPVSSNGLALSYPQPSTRPRGLVDYDDDEDDDECHGPPQRKQPEATEEDKGLLEAPRLKRKLSPKNKGPDLKKQQLCKTFKSKDGVFAALCSTLSHAALPARKNSGSSAFDDNHHGKDPVVPKCSSNSSISSEEEGQREEEPVSRGGSDILHGGTDRQMGGEERPLRTPKSSSEMTVNGS